MGVAGQVECDNTAIQVEGLGKDLLVAMVLTRCMNQAELLAGCYKKPRTSDASGPRRASPPDWCLRSL